jgi:N-formylmaleamate deformylase
VEGFVTDKSTFLYGANIHANSVRQHYLRYGGAGLPVVLLPGITSPAVTWGFVGERLGEQYDVYVLDARGRGLSEASDDFDYSIDTCADDVGAFIAGIGLSRYALMGHSFGARVAVRSARKYAGGLERLVLIDPPVCGPHRRPYPTGLDWYAKSIEQMSHGGSFELLKPFLPTWSEDSLRLRAEWLHTCSMKAVAGAYTSFHQDDMHSDLPHLSIPTLLVAAGKGDVIRPEELDEILRLSSHMRAIRVEKAGHMIPWDDEPGFFDALGDFLGKAVTGARNAA